MALACPQCGAELQSFYRFCGACGANLGTEDGKHRRRRRATWGDIARSSPWQGLPPPEPELTFEPRRVRHYDERRTEQLRSPIYRKGSVTFQTAAIPEKKRDPMRWWVWAVVALIGLIGVGAIASNQGSTVPSDTGELKAAAPASIPPAAVAPRQRTDSQTDAAIAYMNAVQPINARAVETMGRSAQLSANPRLENSTWAASIHQLALDAAAEERDAQRLNPPPCMQHVHSLWLASLSHAREAMILADSGVQQRSVTLVNKAEAETEQVTALVDSATTEIQRIGAHPESCA